MSPRPTHRCRAGDSGFPILSGTGALASGGTEPRYSGTERPASDARINCVNIRLFRSKKQASLCIVLPNLYWSSSSRSDRTRRKRLVRCSFGISTFTASLIRWCGRMAKSVCESLVESSILSNEAKYFGLEMKPLAAERAANEDHGRPSYPVPTRHRFVRKDPKYHNVSEEHGR